METVNRPCSTHCHILKCSTSGEEWTGSEGISDPFAEICTNRQKHLKPDLSLKKGGNIRGTSQSVRERGKSRRCESSCNFASTPKRTNHLYQKQP
ncbi:hypothetical protein SKAU_G00200140 [Synaphobranchus kaupii]|uniref:Uncharacterized protein n=1 Tax=Synaphobranchus kaupii TaxID=118154 RepID=A0A9Q1IYB3_SYNKA|nr:hypothetical protein SKAU_G00200140 [Synaphobranchus kaupii]